MVPILPAGTTNAKPPNPILVGIVAIALIAILVMVPAIFVFLLIGMAPTLIMATRDRQGEMIRVQIMGAMNLAGVLPHVGTLWRKGDTIGAAVEIMLQPSAILMVIAASLAGAGLLWGGPIIAARAVTFSNKREAEQLIRRNKAIERDWGEQLPEDAERMRMGRFDP